MDLKNKKVLITAGPTWVAIDSVRVISNIATGETGILLANKLAEKKAKVTLFLGPVNACCINRRVRIINFRFFDELRALLKKELRARKYDIIIHNAAVSDFKPLRKTGGKISSQKSHTLKLFPLPKIAEEIRKFNPKAKLVIFKLEPQAADSVLIKKARSACRKIKANIIVANRVSPYCAFIIDTFGGVGLRRPQYQPSSRSRAKAGGNRRVDSGNKIVAAGNRKELTNRLIEIL